jgi:hypothetical protein
MIERNTMFKKICLVDKNVINLFRTDRDDFIYGIGKKEKIIILIFLAN